MAIGAAACIYIAREHRVHVINNDRGGDSGDDTRATKWATYKYKKATEKEARGRRYSASARMAKLEYGHSKVSYWLVEMISAEVQDCGL